MSTRLAEFVLLLDLAGCCLSVGSGEIASLSSTNGNGAATSGTGGTSTSSRTTGSTSAGTISGGSFPCEVPANYPNTVVTTLAGNGNATYADGSGGRNGTASFYYPTGVAVGADGNVYVADYFNSRIRRIDPSGNTTTIAGNGNVAHRDGTGGPNGTAEFEYPFGLALDGDGGILVVDNHDGRIRHIDSQGNVTTLPCNASEGIQFSDLSGVVLDRLGNILVADGFNNRICALDPLGTVARTLAENTAAGDPFYIPSGLAIDAAGNLYVGDVESNSILKVDSAGQVTVFAGDGDAGFADGPGTTAEFIQPAGVVLDPAGNLIVTDCSNRIRRIDPAGNVTTVAGNGMAGDADGSGGPKGTAEFNCPAGVAIDNACNIYVAGNDDNRIRKISFGPLPP